MQSIFKYQAFSNITLASQWKKKVKNAKGKWWSNLTSAFLNDTRPQIAFMWGERRRSATNPVPAPPR